MTQEPTSNYLCVGGPLDRQVLRLSVMHPYTLTFNLKGQTGRYANIRNGVPTIYWESA